MGSPNYKMFRACDTLLFPPKINPQRRVWQMRMIILRPRPDQRALVVFVIRVAQIPIKPTVELDGKARFGRLKTHRIRVNQGSRISGWIRDARALSPVLVNAIGTEPRQSLCEPRGDVEEEEVVSHEVQAVPNRMPHTGGGGNLVEIINHRVAVYPVVVIAGAEREVGIRHPVHGRSKRPRSKVDAEIC